MRLGMISISAFVSLLVACANNAESSAVDAVYKPLLPGGAESALKCIFALEASPPKNDYLTSKQNRKNFKFLKQVWEKVYFESNPSTTSYSKNDFRSLSANEMKKIRSLCLYRVRAVAQQKEKIGFEGLTARVGY